jgi:hypothetical protein
MLDGPDRNLENLDMGPWQRTSLAGQDRLAMGAGLCSPDAEPIAFAG